MSIFWTFGVLIPFVGPSGKGGSSNRLAGLDSIIPSLSNQPKNRRTART